MIKKPEQTEEKPEQSEEQPVEPKQPDEITDLISLINELKTDYSTGEIEITTEILKTNIEKLETLIDLITNKDVDGV